MMLRKGWFFVSSEALLESPFMYFATPRGHIIHKEERSRTQHSEEPMARGHSASAQRNRFSSFLIWGMSGIPF